MNFEHGINRGDDLDAGESYDSSLVRRNIVGREGFPADENEFLDRPQEDVPGNERFLAALCIVINPNHHAKVVFRPVTDAESLPRRLVTGKGELSHEDGLRVVHLRIRDRSTSDELVLHYEHTFKPVRYVRLLEFYKVTISSRIIQFWAHYSCPREYATVRLDCATFARNYVGRVTRGLVDAGVLDAVQKETIMTFAHNYVVVMEGLSGSLEGQSRRTGVGAALGNFAVDRSAPAAIRTPEATSRIIWTQTAIIILLLAIIAGLLTIKLR